MKRSWIPILALTITWSTSGETARPIGVVTAVDAGASSIKLHTDAGTDMLVRIDEKTEFLRVAPGERDLKNSVKITIAEVEPGDRILARGTTSADASTVAASSVIVMSKADIDKKHTADRAEWARRGTGGIVTASNPQARELTISVSSLAGSRTVVVTTTGNTVWRRYAPDSVKFSDARPSRFEEVQIGDQIRALGDQSEDGARFRAEEIVSGSFLNIPATVNTLGPGGDTVLVTDLTSKKQLVVKVTADTKLHAVPPGLARMLAVRGSGNPDARPGFTPPGQPPPGSGPGTGRPPDAPRRPRDLESMIERLPAITLADLKPGAAVAIASTRGSDPSEVTAITILSGIEPLLTATPQGGRQMVNGSWNLNLNMNMDTP